MQASYNSFLPSILYISAKYNNISHNVSICKFFSINFSVTFSKYSAFLSSKTTKHFLSILIIVEISFSGTFS